MSRSFQPRRLEIGRRKGARSLDSRGALGARAAQPEFSWAITLAASRYSARAPCATWEASTAPADVAIGFGPTALVTLAAVLGVTLGIRLVRRGFRARRAYGTLSVGGTMAMIRGGLRGVASGLLPLMCASLGAAPLQGQARDDEERGHTTVPLFAGLRSHGHPITTVSSAAQAYFDRGLRMQYAFNHAEGIRS